MLTLPLPPPPGVPPAAETAITIDDVVVVINSGRLKEKSYDPYTNVSTLMVGAGDKSAACTSQHRSWVCRRVALCCLSESPGEAACRFKGFAPPGPAQVCRALHALPNAAGPAAQNALPAPQTPTPPHPTPGSSPPGSVAHLRSSDAAAPGDAR